MNYSPEQLLRAWEKGKSLDEAVWQYSDYNVRKKYENINVKINWDDQSLPRIGATRLIEVSQILGKIGELSKQSIQRKSAKGELWDNIFCKLSRRHLIAVGYKFPIESDFPTLIPLYMWPPENRDEADSSISSLGRKYIRVRIIRKAALQNILKNWEKERIQLSKYEAEKKKPGRPSISDKIIDAFYALIKNGQIDPKIPLNSHYPAIRDAIKLLYPELINKKGEIDGMRDEAIRKWVSPIFNEIKKSQKL